MTAPTEVDDAGRAPRRVRPLVVIAAVAVVVIAVAIAVIVVIVVIVRATAGPDPLHLFGAREPGVGAGILDETVGSTIYVDMQLRSDRVVEVDTLRASADSRSTGAARVDAFLCARPAGITIGDSNDLAEICPSRASVPGTYRVGGTSIPGARGSNTTVVLAVTPTRRGVVHVNGIRIGYHVGDRHGDERAGLDVLVRTT